MSVKNKFPGPVADVKLVPKVAYFAPEWVAYFSPEWVAYFAPERWHTIVRIIHKMDFNGFQAAGKYVFAGHDQILIKMFDCKVNK